MNKFCKTACFLVAGLLCHGPGYAEESGGRGWALEREPVKVSGTAEAVATAEGHREIARAIDRVDRLIREMGERKEKEERSRTERVRERKLEPMRVDAKVERVKLEYLVTTRKAPYYHNGPLQSFLPDGYLEKGTRLAVVKRGKIWSDVRLGSGATGVVANDFLGIAREASAPRKKRAVLAMTKPKVSAVSTIPGAAPVRSVLPELPDWSAGNGQGVSRSLLPPLRSVSP